MRFLKKLEKRVFQNTDPEKLYKYRYIYYFVVFIVFLVITYNYRYAVGLGSFTFYISIFLILSEGSARVRRRKILAGSVGDMFSFAMLPTIILIGLPLFTNLGATNIYFMNFAVDESNLDTISGTVIKDVNHNEIIKINDANSNKHSFVFNYPYNSFKKQEVYVPQGTKVQIKYIELNRKLPSKQDHFRLAYEIRNDDRVYLNYRSAKEHYIKFRSKAIKHILLGSIFYILSGVLIFVLYLEISKEKEA